MKLGTYENEWILFNSKKRKWVDYIMVAANQNHAIYE